MGFSRTSKLALRRAGFNQFRGSDILSADGPQVVICFRIPREHIKYPCRRAETPTQVTHTAVSHSRQRPSAESRVLLLGKAKPDCELLYLLAHSNTPGASSMATRARVAVTEVTDKRFPQSCSSPPSTACAERNLSSHTHITGCRFQNTHVLLLSRYSMQRSSVDGVNKSAEKLPGRRFPSWTFSKHGRLGGGE